MKFLLFNWNNIPKDTIDNIDNISDKEFEDICKKYHGIMYNSVSDFVSDFNKEIYHTDTHQLRIINSEISEDITQDEIIGLMENNNLTLEKVINAIVDRNHIIGVELINLAQTAYLLTFYNKQLRRANITKKEIEDIINLGRKNQFN